MTTQSESLCEDARLLSLPKYTIAFKIYFVSMSTANQNFMPSLSGVFIELLIEFSHLSAVNKKFFIMLFCSGQNDRFWLLGVNSALEANPVGVLY